MSSSEFPRLIAPTEVRKGDTVEIGEHTPDGGHVAWRFVVADVTDKFGTGPCIVPPPRLMSVGGWHCSVFTMVDNPLTLLLLDRPVQRGPAWDAPMGSLWTDGTEVWARNDHLSEKEGLLFYPMTGSAAPLWGSGHPGKIDSLVPFEAPSVDAERERLRDNVIETVNTYVGGEAGRGTTRTMAQWGDVSAAVRALRDYEAAEVSS